MRAASGASLTGKPDITGIGGSAQMDKTRKKPEGMEEHVPLTDEETEAVSGGFVKDTFWYKQALTGDPRSPVNPDPEYKEY